MQKTQLKKRSGARAAKSSSAKAGRRRRRRVAVRQPGAAIKADNWLDTYVPYHLYRVTNKLNARLLKRLKTRRINSSQWRVLSVLRAYGSLSISRIVQTTLLEQPTTSRVVAQLERLGHVRRRPSDLDSRVTEISIMPAGLEAFGSIVPSALKHQTLAFQDISPRKMALLLEVLQQIEHNITRED